MTVHPCRSRSAHLVLAVILILPALALADEPSPGVYDFEEGLGPGPRQWNGGPAATVAVDSAVAHGGRLSARIRRDDTSENSFTPISFGLPADREGRSIELRGWLRSDDVAGWFGMWFRLDGTGGVVAIDNMQKRRLSGTTPWTEYRITLPLRPEARTMRVGALLAGTGTVWADDFSVWVDGKPLAEAPAREIEKTVLDTDVTFLDGSGLPELAPTDLQADNLALLGRVWGFLKYHHPAVTAGRVHWDFALFREMPKILAAADGAAARAELVAWIDGLGPIPPCDPCAEAPADPAQPADVGWIHDTALLGSDLTSRLEAAYAARPADGAQFYVGLMPNVGNPRFDHEPTYDADPARDAGYRLLALFRFWNIVAWCCPNRDIAGEDWPAVLREFVPRLAAAAGKDAYERAAWAMVARLHDTHTQLYTGGDARPPGSGGQAPVVVRWIEGQPVVTGYAHEVLGRATGLEPGDAVLAVDGQPVADLFAAWRPYYSASNDARLFKDLAQATVRGPAGSTRLTVRRGDRTLDLTVERAAEGAIDKTAHRWHTLDGPGFRLLEPGVAYMALEKIKRDSVDTWIERALAEGAQGLVIDCRAYPGDFPIYQLAGHLVAEPTRFVTFSRLDPANPGAFRWDDFTAIQPVAPRFDRPVVVLVDEVTLSSAEFHAMAFRVAPQVVVMGSTTAGADGNVSRIGLPGRLSTMISGIGVYGADRRNAQRAGIVPDVVVEPTIAGIRAGRDEVLEAAVARITGREPAAAETAAW